MYLSTYVLYILVHTCVYMHVYVYLTYVLTCTYVHTHSMYIRTYTRKYACTYYQIHIVVGKILSDSGAFNISHSSYTVTHVTLVHVPWFGL